MWTADWRRRPPATGWPPDDDGHDQPAATAGTRRVICRGSCFSVRGGTSSLVDPPSQASPLGRRLYARCCRHENTTPAACRVVRVGATGGISVDLPAGRRSVAPRVGDASHRNRIARWEQPSRTAMPASRHGSTAGISPLTRPWIACRVVPSLPVDLQCRARATVVAAVCDTSASAVERRVFERQCVRTPPSTGRRRSTIAETCDHDRSRDGPRALAGHGGTAGEVRGGLGQYKAETPKRNWSRPSPPANGPWRA